VVRRTQRLVCEWILALAFGAVATGTFAESGWVNTTGGNKPHITSRLYGSPAAACLTGYGDMMEPGLGQWCPSYWGPADCRFGKAENGCMGIGNLNVGFLDCGSNALFIGRRPNGEADAVWWGCIGTVPDPRTNVGKASGCRGTGNPCDTATGNKYQDESDYVAPNGQLRLVRHYNSLVQDVTGSFGPSWTDHYNRRLWFLPQSIRAERADARVLRFLQSGSAYTLYGHTGERLEAKLDGGGATIGWRLIDDDRNETEEYNLDGLLLSIEDRAGLKQTLTYSDASTPPSIAPKPGLLIRVTDAFGRQLNFVYDSQARVTTATDPAGGLYAFEYDVGGRLATVTYPDTRVRQYHYENASLAYALTGITDENSVRFATWTYDATTGRAIASEHAGSAQRYTLTFNGDGTTTVRQFVSDTLFADRIYSFATTRNLLQNTAISGPACPQCGPASRAYDANNNMLSSTDWNGNRTCYKYDTTRDLQLVRGEGLTAACPADLSTWTPGAGTVERKTTTQWHATWRLPTKVCEPKRITTIAYDTKGNVTSRSMSATNDAQGTQGCSAAPVGTARTWTYTYTYGTTNPAVTTQIVVNGPRTDVTDTTTHVYEEATGNLLTITNAKGHVTTLGNYDAHGKPRQITDANGLITTLVWDDRQRLTSRTVGAETTGYSYDGVGQVTRITNPDGSYLQYVYDDAHRLTEVRDNLGNKVVYTLDLAGNRTREDLYDQGGALVATRAREYDALNRKTKDIGGTSPTTQVTQYGYDNQANLISVDGPLAGSPNDLTAMAYDALNRLKQVTDALSGLTQYGYDSLDQVASVTDPRALPTTYTVSGLGTETQEVSTDRGTTNRVFSAAGLLTSATDARNKTTTYTYDVLNRVTKDNFATGTDSTYEYDGGTAGAPNAKGWLTKIVDEAATTTWTFNSQGRVATKTQVTGSNTLAVTYGYDSFGRLNAITYPSGKVINRTFDAAGRVSTIAVGTTNILTGTTWFPFGAVKSFTWGNGSAYSRTFDADGRVKTFPVGTSTRTLSYDDAGRITWITDSGTPSLNVNAGYDILDRLTSYTGYPANQSYTYDANGNRTGVTIGASSYPYTVATTSNRLTATAGPAPAKTHTFDAAGNITADGTQTFVYTDRGRMGSTTRGSNTVTYKYNALGQRLRKQGPTSLIVSGTNRFVYDEQGKLLGEYQNNGTVIQEYVWLGEQPVAILRGTTASPTIFYVYSDHLDTPRLVTNASNQERWRWDSAPFGDIPPNENPAGLGVFTLNLRFPGQYFDKETGLAYNYFRDYDPQTGRYTTSDPIGLAGGINPYLYGLASPLRLIDILGLDVEAADRLPPGAALYFGAAVHSAFKQYLEGIGLIGNVTFGHIFGDYRPDAIDPLGKQIWELKPRSCESGSNYSSAQRQLQRYLDTVNQRDGGWRRGVVDTIFRGQPNITLSVPFAGSSYDVWLYPDPRGTDSGVLFYDFDRARGFPENFRDAIRRQWPFPLQRPPGRDQNTLCECRM
jgi:RHS repeat-associated protein